MFAAIVLVSMYPDWVPARWPSNDPQSLELLTRTPINCLWLERPLWSHPFVSKAASLGIATVGVIRGESDAVEAARSLTKLGFTAAVLEGNFSDSTVGSVRRVLPKSKMLLIESVPRRLMHLVTQAPILATHEGVWPGIQIDGQRGTVAGPTSAPWVDTNAGFLRYARASSDATIWIANKPPIKKLIPIQHYLQAIGDAAMNGARWVVALDDDFARRLLSRDTKTVEEWQEIGAALQHYEDHREWRGAGPRGGIAVIEDSSSGALLSGGLLDMLAARHLPVFPVPISNENSLDLHGAQMAVNANPQGLSPRQKLLLAAFGELGGFVISMPKQAQSTARDGIEQDAFISAPASAEAIEETWKQVESGIAERNMGARLFNVSSIRSNLLAVPGQRQMLLHLVNYSDYPVPGITVHIAGFFQRARLYRPGNRPMDLEVYTVEEGTGFDIDAPIGALATVVVE